MQWFYDCENVADQLLCESGKNRIRIENVRFSDCNTIRSNNIYIKFLQKTAVHGFTFRSLKCHREFYNKCEKL